MISACSTSNRPQPPERDKDFFTPRNWQIPIVTEEKKSPSTTEPAPQVIAEPQREPEPKAQEVEKQILADSEPDEQMVGYASWYGPGFHGEKTANGEKYDQNELTAAHRILPMNTWVRVTNQENNRTVIVRINDRGPYKKNRIIDLTRKAAEILEFKDQGTARVTLKVVKYPKDYDPQKGLTPYKQTIIQIAVFSTQQRADSYKLQLSQKYTKLPIFIETKKDLYYVLIGPYEDKQNATEVSQALKADGVDNFVRSYKK